MEEAKKLGLFLIQGKDEKSDLLILMKENIKACSNFNFCVASYVWKKMSTFLSLCK